MKKSLPVFLSLLLAAPTFADDQPAAASGGDAPPKSPLVAKAAKDGVELEISISRPDNLFILTATLTNHGEKAVEYIAAAHENGLDINIVNSIQKRPRITNWGIGRTFSIHSWTETLLPGKSTSWVVNLDQCYYLTPDSYTLSASVRLTAASAAMGPGDFELSSGDLKFDVTPADKREDQIHFPLIDTNAGKCVLYKNTTSQDGRFAVGATIRSLPDWSVWDETNPDKPLHNGTKGLQPASFIIDLQTGKTFPLPDKMQSFPSIRGDSGVSATWSETKNGKRYGLVQYVTQWAGYDGNRTRYSCAYDVVLVTVDKDGVHQQSLGAALDKAFLENIHSIRPMDADLFAAEWQVHDITAGRDQPVKTEFSDLTVGIPFQCEIPEGLGLPKAKFNGKFTVQLSDGAVQGGQIDAGRYNPLESNADLRKADAEMHATYDALDKMLPPQGRIDLKQNQFDWLKDMLQDVETDVHNAPAEDRESNKAREKSLLLYTIRRNAQLLSKMAVERDREATGRVYNGY